LTWLSNVVQFVKCVGGSLPDAAGEPNQRPRFVAPGLQARRTTPPADTRRASLPRCAGRRFDERKGACTFYLVFKEPDVANAPRQLLYRQGNLSILPARLSRVNPHRPFRERKLTAVGSRRILATKKFAQPAALLRANRPASQGRDTLTDEIYAPVTGVSTSTVTRPPQTDAEGKLYDVLQALHFTSSLFRSNAPPNQPARR
jgi:hypothetical protein